MYIQVHMNQTRAATAEIHDAKVNASAHRPRVSIGGKRGKLAVVGGGPSVLEHLEELRSWDGDIWAVNYTGKWLAEQGIQSKLFTVDSSIKTLPRWDGCLGAMLPSCISPEIFDEYPDAECFDLVEDTEDETGAPGGTTSIGRVPVFAMSIGYLDIHFFGCEGSFPEGQTHVDRHEDQFARHHMTIKAGDKEYLTRDDLMIQCSYMSSVMRDIPYLLKNRSGGLLQGMIDNPDWVVVGVSPEVQEEMRKAWIEQIGFEQRQQVGIKYDYHV